jgi:LPXTG-motif cell wall-anchored protein
MKTRLILAAAAISAVVVMPTAAHAGAAQAVCAIDGRVVLESTDAALLQHPRLWDFEIRSVKVNGVEVTFSLMSAIGGFERYVIDAPVSSGKAIEFEFREVRNSTEGGDGYVSPWTTHRVESISCPTVSVPPTTAAAAPTTTAGSNVSVLVPPLPTLPAATVDPSPLPITGSDSSALGAFGLGLIALGTLGAVISRRKHEPTS